MGWEVSVIQILIIAGGVLAMGVGLWVLSQRPNPIAWPLALFMFTASAWAIPHAISLGYTDVEQVTFWQQMRFPGTVFAPVMYFVLVLRYAGYERWLSRWSYTGLSVIPLLTIVVVWTNTYHGLYWDSVSITRTLGMSAFVPEFGPWYWIALGYLYLLMFTSLCILAVEFVQSGRVYQRQVGVIFLGGFLPLVTNMAVNIGFGQDLMLDFTSMTLTVVGLVFVVALFHLDLLEVRPVARDRLIEELDDGVVIFGPEGLVRDFNTTAAQIIDPLESRQPVENVLREGVNTDGGEFRAEIDGIDRIFRTRSTTLTNSKGQEIGWILYLNEVTELIKREQRISVLNRVLRHNIRNDLNVVTGYLELLQDSQPAGSEADHARTALEKTQQVIRLAEKARHIEETLQRGDTETVVEVEPIIERVLADARTVYPNASIEYTPTPDDLSTAVRVVERDLLEIALGELVENAVVHSDQQTPEVTLWLDATADELHINVADNGPGITEDEVGFLGTRPETTLEHGSGLGLWLVEWTASLSSGNLSFANNSPRGTTVTLSLPSAEARGDSRHTRTV